MRIRLNLWIFALAAGFLIGPLSFAQVLPPSTLGDRSPASQAAAKAAPKPPYNSRDFSGVWWGRGNSLMMGNPVPPMTLLGQKRFDQNIPSFGPRAVAPGLGNDPQDRCNPLGYPRVLWANIRAFELIQTPHELVQIFEWTRQVREIWIDGRRIPADIDPRYYGYSVGKWDGDNLSLDSTGYKDSTWVTEEGYPHSEDMKLHEVWKHPDSMTIEITMMLDDPTTYTRPWMGGKQTFKLQLPKDLTEIAEDICAPEEEEDFNNAVRDPALGKSSGTN